MIVIVEEKNRKDPEDITKNIVDIFLSKKSLFCCEQFKGYFKKFSVWDYATGMFGIVDEITYDGHSLVPIKYCPFCGEKIEYNNVKKEKSRQSKRLES